MIEILVASLLGVGTSYISEIGDKLITSGWKVVGSFFEERRVERDRLRRQELRDFLSEASGTPSTANDPQAQEGKSK